MPEILFGIEVHLQYLYLKRILHEVDFRFPQPRLISGQLFLSLFFLVRRSWLNSYYKRAIIWREFVDSSSPKLIIKELSTSTWIPFNINGYQTHKTIKFKSILQYRLVSLSFVYFTFITWSYWRLHIIEKEGKQQPSIAFKLLSKWWRVSSREYCFLIFFLLSNSQRMLSRYRL